MLAKTERVSVYQPEQEGREFPEVPVFATPAEEREHRKRRLVAACRAFALHGLRLRLRRPPHGARSRVPRALLDQPDGGALRAGEAVEPHPRRPRRAGCVEGRHALNRAGFVLHAAVHEAHPDIVAMCHAHTVYGMAWAALGRPLDPITQDAACFFEDHVVIADEGGAVAVERDAGKKVAAAFKGVKAAIHQNHGLLTASRHSIESAAFWFIALERCCQQQLMVEATGRHAGAGAAGARPLQPRARRQRLHRLAALPADLRPAGADRAGHVRRAHGKCWFVERCRHLNAEAVEDLNNASPRRMQPTEDRLRRGGCVRICTDDSGAIEVPGVAPARFDIVHPSKIQREVSLPHGARSASFRNVAWLGIRRSSTSTWPSSARAMPSTNVTSAAGSTPSPDC